MSSIDGLSRQVKALGNKVPEPDAIPDSELGEALRQEAHESLQRKIALFQDRTLPPEERSARCQEIDREIQAKKTPARIAQERRYYQRYPVTGARELLIQRLERIRESMLPETNIS